jgi:hypothetical protein
MMEIGEMHLCSICGGDQTQDMFGQWVCLDCVATERAIKSIAENGCPICGHTEISIQEDGGTEAEPVPYTYVYCIWCEDVVYDCLGWWGVA